MFGVAGDKRTATLTINYDVELPHEGAIKVGQLHRRAMVNLTTPLPALMITGLKYRVLRAVQVSMRNLGPIGVT